MRLGRSIPEHHQLLYVLRSNARHDRIGQGQTALQQVTHLLDAGGGPNLRPFRARDHEEHFVQPDAGVAEQVRRVAGHHDLALGPALENHALFPRRTNVQLAVPTGQREIFILIWERGAGETQASGSSSCAAASAAVRLGLVQSPVTVNMPGGTLRIDVDKEFNLTMKGPVTEVARGTLSPSFVRSLR